jgi:hypothetical protein
MPPLEQQDSPAQNHLADDYVFRVDLALPDTDLPHMWVDLMGDELFTFPMDYESRSEFSAPYGDHGPGSLSVWFVEKQAAAAYSSMFKEHLLQKFT